MGYPCEPKTVEGAGREPNIKRLHKTDHSDNSGITDQVYEMQETEEKPRPVRQIEPSYPADLKKRKIGGWVDVEFIVDERGNVTNPIVTRFEHPEFEQPALEAVQKWKFTPGKIDGKPVKVRVTIPVVFVPR